MRSMDVSKVIKDANLLYKVFDDMEVGEENVGQGMIDNASNYVKAGKKIRIRSSPIFLMS